MDLTGLNLVYTPVEIVKNEAEQNTKKLNKIVTIKQNQSIFDLLKSERNEISKMPNSVIKVVDSSSKPIMSNVIPMSKKMIINQKTKKRVFQESGDKGRE